MNRGHAPNPHQSPQNPQAPGESETTNSLPQTARQGSVDGRGGLSWSDFVLTEATRIYEESLDVAIDDREAVTHAIEHDSAANFEKRLTLRATTLETATPLRKSVQQSRQVMSWVVWIVAALAVISGGLAAHAVLADQIANVFGLIAGLLGFQTVMLLAWVVVMIATSRSNASGGGVGGGGVIGKVVVGMGRWLAAKLQDNRAQAAAIGAISVTEFGSRVGRWTVATITHGIWVMVNVGMLVVLAASFIGEGYQFRWDSTWLSSESYARLIETLSILPNAVGFDVPNAKEIAMSRQPIATSSSETVEARTVWSWFFFGCVVMYGLLPRLVLYGLSHLMRRNATRRYRFETTRPGFAKLRRRLMPEAARNFAARHSTTSADVAGLFIAADERSAEDDHRDIGPPVLIGLELREPRSGWPLDVQVPFVDLGMLDGADDQRRVIDELASQKHQPRELIIVCEFRNSPDRGVANEIATLQHAAQRPVRIILTAGREMSKLTDAEAVARRLNDWQQLAERVRIPIDHVHAIDLDHLTRATRVQLEAILTGQQVHREDIRLLKSAFQQLQGVARDWSGNDVPIKQQMQAHRAIAEVYEHERRQWSQLFLGGTQSANDIVKQLKDGESFLPLAQDAMSKVNNLLPPSLRARPRWAAAGALAGAVGCVTAATFISPVAIGALPMWSLIGAAVSNFLPGIKRDNSSEPNEVATTSFADAIRGAVLFAMVLDLQGMAEDSMSRVLDHALVEIETVELQPENLQIWLDSVRHQYDLALATEGAS